MGNPEVVNTRQAIIEKVISQLPPRTPELLHRLPFARGLAAVIASTRSDIAHRHWLIDQQGSPIFRPNPSGEHSL